MIAGTLAAGAAILRFLASPIGRTVLVAALCFAGGWHAKARLDRIATAHAVIAKQRIDIEAAEESATAAHAVIAALSRQESENQETIRDLQLKLAQRSDRCTLDRDTAERLRRIR